KNYRVYQCTPLREIFRDYNIRDNRMNGMRRGQKWGDFAYYIHTMTFVINYTSTRLAKCLQSKSTFTFNVMVLQDTQHAQDQSPDRLRRPCAPCPCPARRGRAPFEHRNPAGDVDPQGFHDPHRGAVGARGTGQHLPGARWRVDAPPPRLPDQPEGSGGGVRGTDP